MTELLTILEDFALYRKYRYVRLDGSSQRVDRQDAIDQFNHDDSISLFLLSTRAGGLGSLYMI